MINIDIPLPAVILIPSLWLLWRAAKRDGTKIGMDGLDDWFKAWVYVALLWACFFIGRLTT